MSFVFSSFFSPFHLSILWFDFPCLSFCTVPWKSLIIRFHSIRKIFQLFLNVSIILCRIDCGKELNSGRSAGIISWTFLKQICTHFSVWMYQNINHWFDTSFSLPFRTCNTFFVFHSPVLYDLVTDGLGVTRSNERSCVLGSFVD